MNRDILICGVGGQGTVLASRIIAAAAMDEGSPVHSAGGSGPESSVSPQERNRCGKHRRGKAGDREPEGYRL